MGQTEELFGLIIQQDVSSIQTNLPPTFPLLQSKTSFRELKFGILLQQVLAGAEEKIGETVPYVVSLASDLASSPLKPEEVKTTERGSAGMKTGPCPEELPGGVP